jgi:catechol 2,3-dioxygenase-like lactoylglutathione lyase family enzyme
MKLDHVAIWAVDIELMRAFYEKYFDARSNLKYENERKRFTSYFLTFPGGGRLELMHRPDIQRIPDSQSSREFIGYAHLGVEWALGPPSTPLQNDCRATDTRFSMGQGGRATDTTRAWSRIPRVTGLSSPNESAAARPGC